MRKPTTIAPPYGKKCNCGSQNIVIEIDDGKKYYRCLTCGHSWWENTMPQARLLGMSV
jgi:hypothetical protein